MPLKMRLMFILNLLKIVQLNVFINDGGYLLKEFQTTKFSEKHSISISFYTKKHNGILWYSIDDESFFSIELYYGSLRISGNFTGKILKDPFVSYCAYGLADNKEHQAEIFFHDEEIYCVVDRGTENMQTSASGSILIPSLVKFLNIYIGNYPDITLLEVDFFRFLSKTGFHGCIQTASYDNHDILNDSFLNNAYLDCPKPIKDNTTITFLYTESYIEIIRKSHSKTFQLEMDILIYQNTTTLISHNFNDTLLNVTFINGLIQLTIAYSKQVIIDAVQSSIIINDGRWHHIYFSLPSHNNSAPRILFYVDEVFKIDSPSPVTYEPGLKIQLGGFGFIGCIENLKVDNESYYLEKHLDRRGISTMGCNITFQCNPNPCNNEGRCIAQEVQNYVCSCPPYAQGKLCEFPLAPQSCSGLHSMGIRINGQNLIDVDGIGPFSPVYAICNGMENIDSEDAITEFPPTKSEFILANNPQALKIEYQVGVSMLNKLAQISDNCEQTVTYYCTKSKITNGNHTSVSWIGGDGEIHDYWNKNGVYNMCDCGLTNECGNQLKCNCDNFDTVSRLDIANLTIKTHLPISYIISKDISAVNGSNAVLKVGSLLCRGFGGDLQLVTFQEVFTYLPFKYIKLKNSGSISFSFRTNQAQGNVVLLSMSKFKPDMLYIYLVNSSTVGVMVKMGNTLVELNVTKSIGGNRIDNNEYQKFKFFISRNELVLKLGSDVTKRDFLTNPVPPQTYLDLSYAPMYLGGTPYDKFNGFKGTIRNMFIDGSMIPLSTISKKEALMGVIPGNKAACKNVDCNYGKCLDNYNYFVCNCAYSPFYGVQCEFERSILATSSSYALAYIFTDVFTFEEVYLSVGFKTSDDGVLLALQGKLTDLFFIVSLEKGEIVVLYNFRENTMIGPETFKVQSSVLNGVLLNDNVFHVVKVTIERYKLYIEVDGISTFKRIEETANTYPYMKELKYYYVGGIVYTGVFMENIPIKLKAFRGCLSGGKALFKAGSDVYQETLIDPVSLYYSGSSSIQYDKVEKASCAGTLKTYEPASLLPYPPNPIPSDVTKSLSRVPLGELYGPMVLGIGVFIVILILLTAAYIIRWLSRNKGIYKTEEKNLYRTDRKKVKNYEETVNKSNTKDLNMSSLITNQASSEETPVGFI